MNPPSAIELLDAHDLPLEFSTGDIRDNLSAEFTKYCNAVSGLTGQDPVTLGILQNAHSIRVLSDGLLRTLDHAMRGRIDHAIQELDHTLSGVRHELQGLISKPMPGHITPTLYRVRPLTPPVGLRPIEMFHLPFELRHLGSTRRYSLPGVPMLYLGRSAYVCVQETRLDPTDDYYISGFRLRNDSVTAVLDFGYRPALMAAMLNASGPDNTTEFSISYATLWPLIASCSVARMHPTAPFSAEYLVPQLLLVWLRSNKAFAGVRYFSTHYRDYELALAPQNYVFPVTTDERSGYCAQLASLFSATAPVLRSTALQAQVPVDPKKYSGALVDVNGTHTPYANTEWAAVEAYVDSLPFHNF